MANEMHLEILRKGVEAWNRWREEHPDIHQPDLSGAQLSGAQLSGVNLIDADLSSADLSGADLSSADFSDAYPCRTGLSGADYRNSGSANYFSKVEDYEAEAFIAYVGHANLRGTNFSYADLSAADFREADLREANLSDANLSGAHLSDADLGGADFRGADLSAAHLKGVHLHGAHFYGAHLGNTGLGNIDLRSVNDLSSVRHSGPSPISTSTLERSQGQIPAEFLRGCGLSDWEIEAAKLWDPDHDEDELTTILYEVTRIRGQQPWALSRVFLSYTREDEPFVKALEKRFNEKGVRYWRDVHDLKAGRLERQIDRAITLYPLVLLVLSERSVLSDWVEWEAAKARELEKDYEKAGEPRDVLCPVSLDDAWKSCSWPGRLRRQIEEYNSLDFSGWEDDEEKMGRQFTKLYEGLVLNYGRKGGNGSETAE